MTFSGIYLNCFFHLCIGGIPGDHLIVPVPGHSVPTPMHLRLGQKDKVWTREYGDKEEDDAMGPIEALEEEEEHYMDGEDKDELEYRDWDNEEEEGEDEEEKGGSKAEMVWKISEFSSKTTQHAHSQHQYYRPQQKAEDDDGDDTVEIGVSQTEANTNISHLGRNRAIRRFRRWPHLRSHGGLGFRLTQHWKNWRQRAQWVSFQGQRLNRRWQRHSLYGKQRRIKRYQQLPHIDGKDNCNNESLTVSQRGIDLHVLFLKLTFVLECIKILSTFP